MELTQPAAPAMEAKVTERPRYETPRLQALSEKEILNTFQITQSMCGWWTTGMC